MFPRLSFLVHFFFHHSFLPRFPYPSSYSLSFSLHTPFPSPVRLLPNPPLSLSTYLLFPFFFSTILYLLFYPSLSRPSSIISFPPFYQFPLLYLSIIPFPFLSPFSFPSIYPLFFVNTYPSTPLCPLPLFFSPFSKSHTGTNVRLLLPANSTLQPPFLLHASWRRAHEWERGECMSYSEGGHTFGFSPFGFRGSRSREKRKTEAKRGERKRGKNTWNQHED